MQKPFPACTEFTWPIFLVGYMGAGKSTLGAALANRCGVPFTDLDAVVEAHWGMSISSGVAKQGELAFRKLEHTVFEEFIPQAQGVVAVGGGTPMYYDHMDQLLRHGTVVFIDPPFAELVKRLKADRASRPLLSAIAEEELPGFIGAHLLERRSTYHRAQVHFTDVHLGVEGLAERLQAYFSGRAER